MTPYRPCTCPMRYTARGLVRDGTHAKCPHHGTKQPEYPVAPPQNGEPERRLTLKN